MDSNLFVIPRELAERLTLPAQDGEAYRQEHKGALDELRAFLSKGAVDHVEDTLSTVLTEADEIERLRNLNHDLQIEVNDLTAECDALKDQVERLEARPEENLAMALVERLANSSAKNYIESSFQCSSDDQSDLGTITVILQRNSGKTPHMLRQEAEASREVLRALLAELRKWAGEVKDDVLHPLSYQESDMGRTCDGFGQFVPDLFCRIDAELSEDEASNVVQLFPSDRHTK